MRRLAVGIAALMLAAACSGGGTTTTTTASGGLGANSPTEAVQFWIDAMVAADLDAAGRLVSDDQLAVLIAVDNALNGPDIAQLARAGISDDVRADYWTSFAESFAEFGGAPLTDLELGEAEQFAVTGGSFAAVEVGYTTRIGSTEIIAVQAPDETWQVDVLATIGPSLVRPLRAILVELPVGEDGTIVRGLLESAVPSLLAGLERPAVSELPAEFVLETESLVKLLTQG